jgi:hypothetical protein
MKEQEIRKEVDVYIQIAKEDDALTRVRYFIDSKGVWSVGILIMKEHDDDDEYYKYPLRKAVGTYSAIPYFDFHVKPDTNPLYLIEYIQKYLEVIFDKNEMESITRMYGKNRFTVTDDDFEDLLATLNVEVEDKIPQSFIDSVVREVKLNNFIDDE